MTERFSLPSWSARNPLGIIALFISLIYGMSAALLGASVKNLTETNQTTLVIFIVVFPFVVLIVFGWLVSKHHRKLYGPGDYRSDEGFLNAAIGSPPSALGQRLREEVAQVQEDVKGATNEASQDTKDRKIEKQVKNIGPDLKGAEQNASARSDPILRAYVAENLVFQELQNEFGVSVKRNLRLQTSGRTYDVDGVLETKTGTTIVEVKFAKSILSAARLAKTSNQYFSEFSGAPKDLRLLLAVVIEDDSTENDRTNQAQEIKSLLGRKIDVRIYSFAELARKYGLIPPMPRTRLGQI